MVVANKILETAQESKFPLLFLDLTLLIWVLDFGLGLGLGLVNK